MGLIEIGDVAYIGHDENNETQKRLKEKKRKSELINCSCFKTIYLSSRAIKRWDQGVRWKSLGPGQANLRFVSSLLVSILI